jgi:hypothetical protein
MKAIVRGQNVGGGCCDRVCERGQVYILFVIAVVAKYIACVGG